MATTINALDTTPANARTNIFLIGFMGSGKTHWGKIWAEANQFLFADLDDLIEKNTGKTISAIFNTDGENQFRKMEAEALRSFSMSENIIIACGGGTPCFYNNMHWMNTNGITIYISCSPAEILIRVLAEQGKRPLLHKMNEDEIRVFIKEKIVERMPFYTQAKYTVSSALLTANYLREVILLPTSK